MKNDKSGLQRYIFIIQVIMIAVLAVLLGAVGIFMNLREESHQRDLNLQNVAEAIAHSELVTNADSGNGADSLPDYLDTLKESLSDIDVISVVGNDNIRLYHSNHNLIGTVFDGTMPDFSSSGKYYTINDKGPSGIQRRAYAEITSSDGSYGGFVMTIMLMSSIRTRTIRTIVIFIIVILAAILIELIISYKISGRVKERLMGYEPDTFTAMYQIRDNILEALNEGIVAVDNTGTVQFANSAAASMIGAVNDSDDAGTDIAVRKLFSETLSKGISERSVPVTTVPGTNIILDRMPVMDGEKIQGAIGILHNRTEYTKLAEDLAGTRFLVDSMRANNHDFTNKLHVILGLLQMEMYDEAVNYIENITMIQRETISLISRAIDVPAVAALLIGKTSRAAELNVKFIFNKESSYKHEDIFIPQDALITVIGNLIDNALEAMNNAGSEYSAVKELYFGIYSHPGLLIITVDDTGPGIAAENMARIFENGFTTKGGGHGTGLYQVRKNVEALGGTISVESQPGEGTSFTVNFTDPDRRQD